MLKLTSLLTAAVLCAAPLTSQNTIADIVVAASGGATAGQFDNDGGDYDILLNALQTANLVGAVSDPNADLTVFAPADRAFIRLARDLGFTGRDEAGAWQFLVNALTALGNGNPVPVLTDILLYHVAPGRVGPFDLIRYTLRRQQIPTLLSGATIRPFFLLLIDNEPDLANPFVVPPINLRASNGVIHGISRVLIPVDLP
ncbi:MAG: fasciclin domain-containing protein [Planctomycetes bacterium]|nr:fasciclin domain-containing protein [Planctomycetota bacterium]